MPSASIEALLHAGEQQIHKRQPPPPLDLVDLIKSALYLLKALDFADTTIALTHMAQLRGNSNQVEPSPGMAHVGNSILPLQEMEQRVQREMEKEK